MRGLGFLLLLAACDGGGGGAPPDDAGLADAPPAADAPVTGPITVAGRVLRPFGIPAAGVRVAIVGEPEVAVTDGDGAFVLADVEVPYDIVVLDDDVGRASIWEGLHRADPLLFALPRVFEPTDYLERRSAVSGTMGPLAPSSDSRIAAALAVQTASYGGSATTAVGDFTIDGVRWHGPPEVTVTVHALQWTEGPADLPATFHGAGSAAGVTLGDLAAATGVAITLAPLTQGDVTIHATAPAGFEPDVEAYLVFDDGAWVAIGWDPAAEVTFPAPDLAGARVAVRSRAVLDGASSSAIVAGVSPGDDVTLALPAPAEPLAPADGAVDVGAGTVFSWRPSVGIHILGMMAIADGPWIAIVTSDASAAIPDLSSYGMPLPPAASYGWSVSGWGPATSTDEITDPSAVGPWRGGLFTSTEANSPSRVFITE